MGRHRRLRGLHWLDSRSRCGARSAGLSLLAIRDTEGGRHGETVVSGSPAAGRARTGSSRSSRPRLPRPAHRAAPPVHLLCRPPAGLRVEPRRRAACSGGPSFNAALRRAVLARHRSRRRRPGLPRSPGGAGPLARAGEVLAYRDRVRAAVLEAVDAVAERRGRRTSWPRDGRVFSMVIEHELMHQETLLYMLQRAAARAEAPAAPGCPRYVLGPRPRPPGRSQCPRGRPRSARAFDDLPFGWDNEFPPAAIVVPAFPHRRDAGDERRVPRLRRGRRLRAPRALGATRTGDGARAGDSRSPAGLDAAGRAAGSTATLFDELPLERVPDWPVYVSLAEARAYARWRGGRLPTEAEFHRAAFGDPPGGERALPWGEAPPATRHGNFDFRHWAPDARGHASRRARAPGASTSWSATAGSGPRRPSRASGFEAACPTTPATRPTSSTATTTC